MKLPGKAIHFALRTSIEASAPWSMFREQLESLTSSTLHRDFAFLIETCPLQLLADDGQTGGSASRLVPLVFHYSLAEPLSPCWAVGGCKLYCDAQALIFRRRQ